MREDIKKILSNPEAFFDGLAIAYKKGYEDGIDFERQFDGREMLTEEEFHKMGIAEIIEKESKKLKEEVINKLK